MLVVREVAVSSDHKQVSIPDCPLLGNPFQDVTLSEKVQHIDRSIISEAPSLGHAFSLSRAGTIMSSSLSTGPSPLRRQDASYAGFNVKAVPAHEIAGSSWLVGNEFVSLKTSGPVALLG